MALTFPFEVHTPSHLFFREAVQAVIVTIPDGEIEILSGHHICTAPVMIGYLKIKTAGGSWKTAFTSDGIIEVTEHKTVLLSEAAEWGNEIDHERALKAKETAEDKLKKSTQKFEIDNAISSLKRAEYRLKVWEMNNRSGDNK